MKAKTLSTLLTVTLMSTGGWLVLTGQAQAAGCRTVANKPYYEKQSDYIYGSAGQTDDCSSGSYAKILLRHDRTLAPDTTMSEATHYGNFISSLHKSQPEDGQYYMESRASSGANSESARYHHD